MRCGLPLIGYAARGLAVMAILLVPGAGWVAAQPVAPLPTINALDVVVPGAHNPLPSTTPKPWRLGLRVDFEPAQWLRIGDTGLAGRIDIERLSTEKARVRLHPDGGGSPVDLTFRLPVNIVELIAYMGTSISGRIHKIPEPRAWGHNQRLQVSTPHGRLEMVTADVPTPAKLRFDRIQITQHDADDALGTRLTGWYYPVPVTVRVPGAGVDLWQGQAAILEAADGTKLLAVVTASAVAKPTGAARHVLEAPPYLLKMFIIRPP